MAQEARTFSDSNLRLPLGLRSVAVSLPNPHNPTLQEDAFYYSDDTGVAVIASGHTDYPNPSEAARVAVDTVGSQLSEIPGDVTNDTKIYLAMKDIFIAAHSAVRETDGRVSLTAVKFVDNNGSREAMVGHIGRTRAGVFDGEELAYLTFDDASADEDTTARIDRLTSLADVEELRTAARAAYDSRHTLPNYVGDNKSVPRFRRGQIIDGDRVLLLSPGVPANLTYNGILTPFRERTGNQARALAESALTVVTAGSFRSEPASLTVLDIAVLPRRVAHAA